MNDVLDILSGLASLLVPGSGTGSGKGKKEKKEVLGVPPPQNPAFKTPPPQNPAFKTPPSQNPAFQTPPSQNPAFQTPPSQNPAFQPPPPAYNNNPQSSSNQQPTAPPVNNKKPNGNNELPSVPTPADNNNSKNKKAPTPTNTNSQQANNKNITNFNNVCKRLQKLHGSIEASFIISEHQLNDYFSIPANKNTFNEYIANILSNFGEYLKTYQGLKGHCAHNNTNKKVIQIKDIDTLRQYLRVLWKFMIVIPLGQEANAPTILKKNMEEFLPEVFLDDFQNAFPNNMPNPLTGNTTNTTKSNQKGGGPNNQQTPNPNQTQSQSQENNKPNKSNNNNNKKPNKSNTNNSKPNKKQTLFLKKYFKENDPLLNTYAYLQLKIMLSIAKLLKFLDDLESKGLLVKP
jgi:hypothetical protein